jgi:hypothetical protein
MSRRVLAAGVAAIVLGVGVAAHAQGALKTFTDPQNRFSFQHPASLPVDVTPPPADRPDRPLNIAVGAADYECQMYAVARPNTASTAPDALVRSYGAPLTADVWKRSADGFALYNRQAVVGEVSVDTSKFWPVQRAQLTRDGGTAVIAAFQARPGVELWQFCTGFDGRDHSGVFNQIIGSFAGPNDAALQAQAEQAAAARASQQAEAQKAAQQQAAQPPEEEQKKKRRSGRAQAKDINR